MTRIFLFLVFLVSFYSKASIITVTNTLNSGAGSLREAIYSANSQDTINFDSNLILNGSDTIVISNPITIIKALTIRGLYNSSDTLYIKKSSSILFDLQMNNSISKFCILDSLVLISSSVGLAIRCVNSDSLVISNSTIRNFLSFDNNSGTIDCFGYNQISPKVIIKNSVITGNKAHGNGGAISCHSINSPTRVSIFNSTISDNYSNENGGGVSCYSENSTSTIEVHNSTITNNEGSYGGGINAYSINDSCLIQIFDSKINSNYARAGGHGGGGIFLRSDNSKIRLELKRTKVNNNHNSTSSSSWGGGIYCGSPENDGFVQIDSSEISNNHSDNAGGLFCNSETSIVNINYSTFSNNSALLSGGGLYLYPYNNSTAYLTIENSTFNGNSTPNAPSVGDTGGAIECNNAVVNINNSTICNNSSNRGGGLCVWYTTLSLTNCTVTGNSADSGDGIYSYAGSVNFNSSIFALNDNDHKNFTINSGGFNIFSHSEPSTIISSDQYEATSISINLGPLQNNGGFTETLLPLSNSIAIDLGNYSDFSDAQNGIISGITRDVGAAEHCISGTYIDTSSCGSYTIPSGTETYTSFGNYLIIDTLSSICSMDSIIFINLTLGDNTPPVPNFTSLPDIIETCQITSLIPPSATDDCSDDISITNNIELPIVAPGLTVVDWTIDDQNGNTITQSQNIYIQSDLVISTTQSDEVFGSDGSISLTMIGGLQPYTVLWSNGETTENLQDLTSGTYSVEVTDGNGCLRTETILINSQLTIKQVELEQTIVPNPNRGVFQLQNYPIGSKINIYALDGRLIENNIIINSNIQIINISGVPKGVYIIEVKLENNYKTQRLIIN